ncbi:hypothetical protein N5P37_000972 [Trichoderma harzianum]|uniref:Cyanophycinase n=1 Tax=Trichoderma harzianum CBS 226.95 TaxID=983964 RepID=A0A2T4AJF7_TRIHA|nr:hypothetical protein M431DRAFT_506924 [Trichoderma harzianum CBS 226.95]KAK0767238.1 hypothetical protein N5P37_000972 [Trichoderma harzianum]PKK48890.1 hypothetical protein CI102_5450 [Trichoderma harzianum]PTB57199.1 hypothetical protein M431DRAFT_506924 [Trichoderma harzianum CBS 226.95]
MGRFIVQSILALAMAVSALPTDNSTQYVGPANGNLVIVGGGTLDDAILQKVIDLAGGNDSSIVVIPTAQGDPSYDQNAANADDFRRLGSKSVTVLHTYDPAVANTEEFVQPLLNATGVWFGGGRQWRLVDAYAGTLTEQKIRAVLDAGGVIGGSSAGASIQGDFLARGDTKSNSLIIGDHQQGFAYVKNVAIDQHVLVRNRHFDMLNVLKYKPGILGIAINENTAVHVSKNTAEIFGASYAIIYDGTYWSRDGGDANQIPDSSGLFYFVRAGDVYDLGLRKVVHAS